jgi:CRISPR-associated protein Cmr1
MTNRLTDDDQLRLSSAASIVNTKVYQLQLITPMAVHGYYSYKGSKAAEFRISSLRGALRYWWRTLQFNKDREDLLSDEIHAFGGIKPKVIASPVKFFTQRKNYPNERYKVLPGKEERDGKRGGGGTFLVLNEKNIIKVKMMVEKGSNIDKYDQYFNYMMLLGSIGQRSRRGFGAFQFVDTHFATISDFKNYLIQLLEELGVPLTKPSDTAFLKAELSKQNSDHPCLSSVYIGVKFPRVDIVLKKYEKAAHLAAKDYGDSLGSAGIHSPKLSSPLWGTVKRIGDGYYPVVTELMSRAVRKRPNYNSGKKKFLEVLGVKE